MKLTKFTHACVRLEKDGRVLVIDPGHFSETEEALAGAEAVLITHEHADHMDVDAVLAALRPSLRLSSMRRQAWPRRCAKGAAEAGPDPYRSPRARRLRRPASPSGASAASMPSSTRRSRWWPTSATWWMRTSTTRGTPSSSRTGRRPDLLVPIHAPVEQGRRSGGLCDRRPCPAGLPDPRRRC